MRTAEAALKRLESSALYQRREREATRTREEARLRAIWYGDEKFIPRYADLEAQR